MMRFKPVFDSPRWGVWAVLGVVALAGCSSSYDEIEPDTSADTPAGVYAGLVVQDDGGAAWASALIVADRTGNISIARPADRVAAVASGRFRDSHYDGVIRWVDGGNEPLAFDDQDSAADIIASRFDASELQGAFSLARDREAVGDDAVAGDYAFVDDDGRRWSVNIDAEGAVRATSDDCSFAGDASVDSSGEDEPFGVALAAGDCSPFSDTPQAVAYLAPDVVGTEDALRVVFTDPDTPYDWLWFRL